MQQVTAALAALHGRPERAIDPLAEHCGGQTLVLDSLIRTLLSQNTTDKTSLRAFITLKERFPTTWEAVLKAPNEEIEDAIRVGGLAAIKTERMKILLATLKEERGSCCLEWLRDESTDTIKRVLGRFKGIGPKTISCVLLFCLHRPDFPVDTHVHHISKLLNWCPQNCSREQCYDHLNVLVPDDVKYELHVLLVKHGKVCAACLKGKGASGKSGKEECPLVEFKRPIKKLGNGVDVGNSSGMHGAKEEQKVGGKKRPKETAEAAAAELPKTKIKVEKIVAVKKEEEN
jgi:endonuclease-3